MRLPPKEAGLASAVWLKDRILPAALLAVLALDLWIGRNRDNDSLLLISVTSLAARFWIFHSWYDVVSILLGGTVLLLLATGGVCLLPSPLNSV